MGMPFDWHLPGIRQEASKSDSWAAQGPIRNAWSLENLSVSLSLYYPGFAPPLLDLNNMFYTIEVML